MSAQYNSVPTDNILTWLLKIMRNNCLKSYLPQTLLGIAFKGKHKIPNKIKSVSAGILPLQGPAYKSRNRKAYNTMESLRTTNTNKLSECPTLSGISLNVKT